MLKILPRKKTSRELKEERLNHLWQEKPDESYLEKERIERIWNLIRKIPDLKNKRIIDVGCGRGEIVSRLLKEGATIHALDAYPVPLPNCTYFQELLPLTKLESGQYDLVICTDVIAYLPPQEHRLLVLELSRLLKEEGQVICSTPLDTKTEDPLDLFSNLFQTEFTILEERLSYHALYLRIGINSKRLLKGCERITAFFLPESGVSHAIFIGKRKSWR